jgi:hypothetical protein
MEPIRGLLVSVFQCGDEQRDVIVGNVEFHSAFFPRISPAAQLKRPSGATSKELMKATGWLPHSVRGFLSGTVGKKMGLTVISTKGEDGERTYSVEA